MSLGFRILERKASVSREIAEKFKGLPVANVSDVMNRMTAGGPSLRPYHKGGPMCGAALTVKTRPGDNLMVHKALQIMTAGDVIVVDAGGDLTNAIIGELMLSYAIAKQGAGVVINGAIRDVGWIRENGLPVYAAGVTHRGPYKDGPGEINVPLSIDGMIIAPGDLVIGDDDGILCVPADRAGEIYEAAEAKRQAEEKIQARTAAGDLDKKVWVDEALRKLGCEGV
jgi:RraA family protein